MSSINEGDRVKWNWGSGTGTGKVTQKYTQKRTLKISGTEITRDASAEEPSFRIEQDDGDEVFKSITEIEKA
ncbi:DUF2945 domain-containing protein [Loktanella sp. SALINAS62]|uniref:DUF2945 domain-containing protein n=1 Tax=Loktanella sp. SALINAS62 TaxID=2706124 RepID=UPI001B8CE4BC|nr:DUF2945 domain-containing protein [Loktanella sp. SALINAS62]MBS1302228.1 HVA1 family protein [Loktanella sp. SALINAS62]